MRFSIKTLLAITFLIALALLAWRTIEDARRDRARLELVKAEVKQLEARVRLDDPELHQVILCTIDEVQPLHVMRERAIAHFDMLREKYSSIEPRGPEVLSIRGLPSMQVDNESSPTVFRMIVPEERGIWLKFGVHQVERNMNSSRSSDQEDDLLSDSPFDDSGPFEIKLSPGDQTLSVAAGPAKDGLLPIEIRLDEALLLRTTFHSPDVSGTGSSHISAPSQIDFDARRELPWLLSSSMGTRSSATDNERGLTYAFSMWLSDRSSDFKGFPSK